MQFHLSADEIRPLVSEIVQATVNQMEAVRAELGDQLAYSESHAARLLGLKPHQLRDERIRGRISSTRIVGGQIRYSRGDLEQYLIRHRAEAVHSQSEGPDQTKGGKR